jgi:hypothetical protein
MLQHVLTPIMFRPSVDEVRPTMSSADFCKTIRLNCFNLSDSFHILQTSRGKTQSFHNVNARFIKRIPFVDGRLRGHVPTGLEYVTPSRLWPPASLYLLHPCSRIRFLFVAPPFCVGLPPADTSRCKPCPFANLRLHEYLVRGLSPL